MAWLLSLAGKREAAAQVDYGARAARAARARGLFPTDFSSVEASLATLRGIVSWGDVGVGLENAYRAAELEGPTAPWRPLVCLAVGAGLYYNGQFEQADEWLAQSTKPGIARGLWRLAISSLSIRSLVAGELERIEAQTLHAEQAVELARRHGLEEIEVELFAALGAWLVTCRRFDEALSIFERGTFAARLAGHPRPLAELLVRHAALLQALDRKDAPAVLEDARAAVNACPDPGFLAERQAALERPRRTHRERHDGALSDRELVVLRMLGGRLSERDIGRELYLSHNTVHSHTKSIYRKLGASSRTEALRQARQLGLI